ncbi:Hypothetical protein PHPALM_36791 [Phytophthora palmivora]|uniref:Uncharacterized protein n=1 Tax=Phytophthora palmivora TaxID=4796 RepID=A0A2P4WZ20_9STRA|nr:Hypothetical protein PHPALM_36791 [Phytophthora palmivora]
MQRLLDRPKNSNKESTFGWQTTIGVLVTMTPGANDGRELARTRNSLQVEYNRKSVEVKEEVEEAQCHRVILRDKARHKYNGVLMTCFDMWYKAWRNGTQLPKNDSCENTSAAP